MQGKRQGLGEKIKAAGGRTCVEVQSDETTRRVHHWVINRLMADQLHTQGQIILIEAVGPEDAVM